MPQFAVLHIEKCSGQSTGVGQHIDRTRCPKNADPSRQELNKHYIGDRTNLTADINKRIKEGYTGEKAIRKDAVKSLRFILSGSHDRMKEMEKEPGKITEWARENYAWMCEKYGEKNIMRFTLHMDETTPHIHAVVVPLTKDGRLSAKEITGGPKGMEQLQDEYGAKMARFGLERGLKSSPSKHTDISEFYGAVNEPLRGSEVLKAIEEIPSKGLLESSEKHAAKVREHLKPLLGRLFHELSQARGIMNLNGLIDPQSLKMFRRSPMMEPKQVKNEPEKPKLDTNSQKTMNPPKKQNGRDFGL